MCSFRDSKSAIEKLRIQRILENVEMLCSRALCCQAGLGIFDSLPSTKKPLYGRRRIEYIHVNVLHEVTARWLKDANSMEMQKR
jgi:hypothetical protein